MRANLFFRRISKTSIEKTKLHGQYYTTFGVLGTIYYIIPYFIWSHNSDIEHQTLFLRIFACVLCFYLVIFHQSKIASALRLLAHEGKKKAIYKAFTKNEITNFLTNKIHSGYLPLYWHITLCYCLPLMSTYNLLDSSLQTTWIVNSSLSILILVLLVDWISFIVIMFVGIGGGFFLFLINNGNLDILYEANNYFLVIYVHFFSIIIGSFFLYQKEVMVKQIKQANAELVDLNANLDDKVKKRTDFLDKALKSKTEFLNNISHEIRTPLQGILGLSSTLAECWSNYTDKEREEQVRIISESGVRLMTLVSNLLDISKFEAGKMLFDFGKHNLITVIEHAIVELKPLCYEKHIEIFFIHPKNIKKFNIEFDLYRIAQVIRNFLSNAIKYSGSDVFISLSFVDKEGKKSTQEKAASILVEVRDNGVGVPENELHVIFFPFSQSSRTNKKAGGTGLGLALCAEIIYAHNGKIWAFNNVNEAGSTFCFTIPLEQSNSVQHVIEPLNKKPNLRNNKKNKYKILFVDDEKFCLVSGKVILESAGFDVVTASCGADALEILSKDTFDLILLDLMMPDIYGAEILLKIKSDKHLTDIPVILQSGASDQAEILKIISLGADGYIIKPYNKTELVKKIKDVLRIQ